MGGPITQDRLNKYLALEREAENCRERIARMESRTQFPTMGEPSESKHQPGSGDRMERDIIRLMECREKSEPIIEANEAEMKAIENAIDALADPLEREVLRLRYIDGSYSVKSKKMKWKDVALIMYGNNEKSTIDMLYQIHNKALQNIGKVETE